VYVFFDTQCPHCARLWEASVPLQKKAKFVWIPVGLLNAASSSAGRGLAVAADPAQTMAEHEKSMLAGQGGISAPPAPRRAMQEALKANTRLFNNLGMESVPFTITRNARTGTDRQPRRRDGHRHAGRTDRRRRALTTPAAGLPGFKTRLSRPATIGLVAFQEPCPCVCCWSRMTP
jgi:hypothetical protein